MGFSVCFLVLCGLLVAANAFIRVDTDAKPRPMVSVMLPFSSENGDLLSCLNFVRVVPSEHCQIKGEGMSMLILPRNKIEYSLLG